jgi:hypothetical protein
MKKMKLAHKILLFAAVVVLSVGGGAGIGYAVWTITRYNQAQVQTKTAVTLSEFSGTPFAVAGLMPHDYPEAVNKVVSEQFTISAGADFDGATDAYTVNVENLVNTGGLTLYYSVTESAPLTDPPAKTAEQLSSPDPSINGGWSPLAAGALNGAAKLASGRSFYLNVILVASDASAQNQTVTFDLTLTISAKE